MATALIVQHSDKLANELADYLRANEYDVEILSDGRAAKDRLRAPDGIDAVILGRKMGPEDDRKNVAYGAAAMARWTRNHVSVDTPVAIYDSLLLGVPLDEMAQWDVGVFQAHHHEEHRLLKYLKGD